MKLLPVILGVVGLAGGAAAGHFMKPPPPEEEMAAESDGAENDHGAAESGEGEKYAAAGQAKGGSGKEEQPPLENADFIKLNKQFVVPVLEGERVGALIVMSMAIEAEQGLGNLVFEYEPKLRDEFLQVLFRHAQSGGFGGVFTAEQVMQDLRASLLHAARGVLGSRVHNVLLTDIVRQDI
ncbi:MAG: flagellar basal body-associated protein FliL [Pseudomonadota bacterium]